MGTTIDAIAFVTGSRWRGRNGRKLANAAAHGCLEVAGLRASDVDLLINAGIYHDRNLGEPALAALIQEDIGANPEDPHAGGHGTFSFDVANGACGMLTGLHVADGFLEAGTIRHALVVASDTNPDGHRASAFPFTPAGGALLCSWRDGSAGITGFQLATAPPSVAAPAGRRSDSTDGFQAVVGFDRGRNRLRIRQAGDFAAQAAAWATRVASDVLAEEGLGAGDIDLLVANPQEPELLETLSAQLGIPADRVVGGNETHVHTAGLAGALHEASRGGRLAVARTGLWVSAGAGPTAAAAILRPAPAKS
jgi:3-oxoacyl-[acyl-carrier-protein] synthase-3